MDFELINFSIEDFLTNFKTATGAKIVNVFSVRPGSVIVILSVVGAPLNVVLTAKDSSQLARYKIILVELLTGFLSVLIFEALFFTKRSISCGTAASQQAPQERSAVFLDSLGVSF